MAQTLGRATKQVRQFFCGLHGHDTLLHFDNRHVSLVCTVCGHESPGWNVPGAAAVAATHSAVTSSVSRHTSRVAA